MAFTCILCKRISIGTNSDLHPQKLRRGTEIIARRGVASIELMMKVVTSHLEMNHPHLAGDHHMEAS